MSLPAVPMQLVIVSADDDPLSCARTQSWQSAGRKFLAPQHVITRMRKESWLAGDEKWPARRQLEIGDSSSFPPGSFPLQNLFQSSSLGCTLKEGFRFYRSVNMFGGKELSGGQLPVKTDGWQPAMRNSSPGCWERERCLCTNLELFPLSPHWLSARWNLQKIYMKRLHRQAQSLIEKFCTHYRI